MNKFVIKLLGLTLILALTQCSTLPSTQTPGRSNSLSQLDGTVWSNDAQTTWRNLQPYSTRTLIASQASLSNPTEKAWVQLAIINKKFSNQPQALYEHINAWKKANPVHPANQLLPATLESAVNPAPKHIALLLPQHGLYAAAGQSVKDGFLHAYYANKKNQTPQTIRFYDTSAVSDINLLYQKAVAEGADMIIGPLLKENVQALETQQILSQPILALNYTNSHNSTSSRFYQFGLLPEDESEALAMRALSKGANKALVIAPNNNWGKRLVAAFDRKWKMIAGKTATIWYYSQAGKFDEELKQQLGINSTAETLSVNPDIDSVFLFAPPQTAAQLLPRLHSYLPDTVSIYANAAIKSLTSVQTAAQKLNEVIVCELPSTLKQLKKANPERSQPDRLYAVGQDAYLISQNFQRLSTLPQFPIYGATGALTLANNQIHRHLPCHALKTLQ